jgi:hypothetical protein
MREFNFRINFDKIKDKLGYKEADLKPIIHSISTVEKAIKDKKFDKVDTTKIERLLKDISDKKVDNKELISSINKLAESLNRDDKDYTDKFDALIIKVGELGLYKPGYNKYDPQIRNGVGDVINPSTSEKQDAIISAIQNNTSPTYTLRLAESGNYTYIGEAEIGSSEASAVWRVKRIDETSGMVILFAGTGVFDQVWDNYASLVYN